MKNLHLICMALAILPLTISCGSGRKATKEKAHEEIVSVSPKPSAGQLVSTECHDVFAVELFKKVLAADKSGNVVVSPYSAGMALSMLKEGAAGSTMDGLNTALRNSSWRGSALEHDGCIKVHSANSVWIRQGFDVKKDYANTLTKYYGAQFNERDFSGATVKEINKWCSDHTAGRIPSIIGEISPSSMLFLINALYFKAPWDKPFSPSATRKDIFNGVERQEVDFMHLTTRFPYMEWGGNKIISIPYKDKRYAMLVCCPSGNADELVRMLDSRVFAMMSDAFSYRRVSLSMPKFRVDTKMSLNSVLSSMGAGDAFSTAADFSGMTSSRVAVDEVLQKCFVEVNEEGAEAAAVTSAGMMLTSVPEPPVEMKVDKPFLFAIMNVETNEILFIGRINKI